MVLDKDFYFVPQESNLADVQRAFFSDDPEVHRLAKRERFKELGIVVRQVMTWLVDRPVRTQRLDAAVVASVFGITLRRGLTDEMLAKKYAMNVEEFQRRKDEVLQAVGLRCVTRQELQIS